MDQRNTHNELGKPMTEYYSNKAVKFSEVFERNESIVQGVILPREDYKEIESISQQSSLVMFEKNLQHFGFDSESKQMTIESSRRYAFKKPQGKFDNEI